MKVNIYKSEEVGYFTLGVSDTESDMTEALVAFLKQVEGVDHNSLKVEKINMIHFAIDSSIQEEKQRDLKLSIITAVRKILGQDEGQLKSSYMINQQQLEVIEKSFAQIQQQAISLGVEVAIYQKYIQKLETVMGISLLVTLTAIAVAIVGMLI